MSTLWTQPVEKIIWRDSPLETFWGIQLRAGFKYVFQDDHQYWPTHINGYSIYKYEETIICDIITKKGPGKNRRIPRSQMNWETYSSSVVGYEHQLINLGWITKRELNNYALSANYTTKYHPDDIVAHQPIIFGAKYLRQPVLVTIKRTAPHTYAGELTPEYYVVPRSATTVRKGWCPLDQLRPREQNDISWDIQHEDILITGIRLAIEDGNHYYSAHNMLSGTDPLSLPLDISLFSSFYGLKNEYDEHKDDITEILNLGNYRSNIGVAKRAIKHLLNREFDTFDPSSNVPLTIKHKMTKNVLLSRGLYIDRNVFDFGMKIFCKNNNINMHYESKWIEINIKKEELSLFVAPERIDEYENDSQCAILSDVQIKYSRSRSYILTTFYEYESLSSMLIRMKKQEENNQNQ